jgi:ketosteroid isomerase-like protein
MPFTGPVEDRLAIRELLEAYADAVTRCDAGDWGATWAEDAHWSLPDYPEIGTTNGRAAIVAMWIEAMKAYPGIMFEAWPGSIDVDGDRAVVRSYTSEVYDQDGQTKRDRGRYEDVCVKLDGKWLFASRSFRNIHRQG